MRPARPEDAEKIDAFLSRRAEGSMYLRDNLRLFGPCGGEGDRATRIWIAETGAGEIEGAVGVSNAGFLFVAMQQRRIGTDLPGLLAGERIEGIVGPTELVEAARRALGLEGARVRRDMPEPQYSLELEALILPPGNSELRLAEASDAEVLTRWRADFLGDVFAMPAAEAALQAARQVAGMIAAGRLAVLESAGRPIAMTAFNAVLPDIVQVGNVYTPPALRGRRYARRAVALHLERARADGVRRAVLSAADTHAARAYEAIGFTRIGLFSMLMFDGAQGVEAA